MGFARTTLAALALAAVASAPAAAIVGGSEDAGPLSRASIMVLSARGGVCSGVVVAPDAVLTAAHCVSGASEYRVHYKGDDGQPVLLVPAAIAVHPGYDRGAVAGRRRSIDLALVRLAVPLESRFQSAALAAEAVASGDPVTFAGYGVAREKDGRSTGTFRSVALNVVEPYGRSTILVWAKGASGKDASGKGASGMGACEGDSGGPVSNGSGVMAVTSWASGGGRNGCGDISQGVLVGPQRSWIDGVLAGWGRHAAWR